MSHKTLVHGIKFVVTAADTEVAATVNLYPATGSTEAAGNTGNEVGVTEVAGNPVGGSDVVYVRQSYVSRK